jgi:hypothetical protein
MLRPVRVVFRREVFILFTFISNILIAAAKGVEQPDCLSAQAARLVFRHCHALFLEHVQLC